MSAQLAQRAVDADRQLHELLCLLSYATARFHEQGIAEMLRQACAESGTPAALIKCARTPGDLLAELLPIGTAQ